MRAVAAQHGFLGGRGEQPVPGHANTLATITDILLELKRHFLPDLKAGVYTAKALAKAAMSGSVVFWHTGGVLDAVGAAQEASS